MMTIASTFGWFSRILNVTIELDGPIVSDDGEEFIIPWDSFTGQVALFECKDCVSGRVKIVVMDGIRVWHTGLLLNIEQYLHYLDPFVSSDLCAREMKITMDSNASGIVPLNISQSAVAIKYSVNDIVHSPLTSGTSKAEGGVHEGGAVQSDKRNVCRWLPTYNGEAFGLRHSLMVTLCRPWYAHSPELCIPVKLFSISQETGRRPGNGENLEDRYDNPSPLMLTVADFSGLCVMTSPSRWVDLDQPIVAKIALRDYTVSIVSVHLLLIRTEYIHDAHKDSIVFVHRVFGQAAEELRDIIPAEAQQSSGYLAREDHNDPPSEEQGLPPQGSGCSTPTPTRREDSVRAGEGPCATFVFEFPMGNAPCMHNSQAPASSSFASPSASSSSSTASSSSSSNGSRSNPSSSGPDTATPKASEGESSPKVRAESSVTYRERVQRMKDLEKEVETRKSRLHPSFDTSQQDGEPFQLHIPTDSDDESDTDDEEEEEDEKKKEVDLSEIELQDLSFKDPEKGGDGKREGGTKGIASSASALATGSEGEENEEAEVELAEHYMRVAHRRKLRAAKAELQKRRKKPYFDFLGDTVSVRYFLRLVIQDGGGECRWNTEEIVLFRSKPPHNSANMSAVERSTGAEGAPAGAEYQNTSV